jgi:uncharacterized protein YkwD
VKAQACFFRRQGKVRSALLLMLIVVVLAALVCKLAPWASVQQAFTALIAPAPTEIICTGMAPRPDYYASSSEQQAIEAINTARMREGLPRLNLPADYWGLAPAEQQFVLVNLERSSRGLPPLQWDANLAHIATAYSQQMVQLDFFAHDSPISGGFPARLDANPQIGGHYQTIAENLSGNRAPAAGAIYEYLYNDTAEQCSHRQNILNPTFRLIGIGVVPGGPWGAISTQEFLAPDPLSPYNGNPPNTTPPRLSLTAQQQASPDSLPVKAQAADSQAILQITWFLDDLEHPAHLGETWTLDASMLTPGVHHLTVYAVDASQNFTAATCTLTVGPNSIALTGK